MTTDELIRAAAEAWPGVEVPLDEARRFIEARAAGTSPSLLAVDELYLCCACLRGDGRALECFERTYLRDLDVSLGSYGSDVASEVVQVVRVKLVGPAQALAEYRGRGALRSWVRVTAVRAAIELVRSRKSTVAVDETTMGVAGDDVEFEYFREEHAQHLKAAIGRAAKRLEVRERNVLRQHLIDRLNIDEIGRLYQVNRVTAYRWIEAAREKLIAQTRAELAAALGLGPDELQSLLRAAPSQVDLSLKRIL